MFYVAVFGAFLGWFTTWMNKPIFDKADTKEIIINTFTHVLWQLFGVVLGILAMRVSNG